MKNNTSKNRFRAVILMILVIISVFSLTGCAGDKEFEVDTTITQQGIILEFDNETGSEMRIGHAGGEIVIVTDEGTYTKEFFMGCDIPRGNSQLVIEAAVYEGTVERIELVDLSCLSDRGLPNEKMKKVVVYDIDKGIEDYEGSFSFFSSGMGMVVLVGAIGFGLVGTIIIVMIIIAIRASKKNKQAMQQFAPFGTQNMNNDAAFDMHQQAHQRAVSDHQSFINHQAHNQAMSDAHTALNHGGFTPPPSHFEPPTPPTPPMGF